MRRFVQVQLIAFLIVLASQSGGQTQDALAQAMKPLQEGVPEVTIARLQILLTDKLPDETWRIVAEKLVEARVAANQPAEALKLLEDPRLGDSAALRFWRAQALASLRRWKEALPFYEEVAADKTSPFRVEATFGAGETLVALERRDDALKEFLKLLRDQTWAVRAQLRAAEIYLDKSDTMNARRLLDIVPAKSTSDRKTRHFLRGRLEIVSQRPDRAIPLFESLIKRSQKASHPILVAALFSIADAHLQMKTPESGDDVLEDFIEHNPRDVDLPRLFSKLDELYRAQRKPARSELERWSREPTQPRRGLARWYLARLDLRAGHRDRALQSFVEMRRENAKSPAPVGGMLEFARLQMEDRHFDESLAILNEARQLKSDPVTADRIALLIAEANYRARRFEAATTAYEQIAYSPSPFSKIALFNASAGWLQMDNHSRFATDYQEFANAGGSEEARVELRLEEGLAQAAKGGNQAEQTLRDFVRDFPKSPRVSEAWVALAELAFHAAPPRLDEARKHLAHAADAGPNKNAAERADYLRIWVEESTQTNEVKVIDLANRFIRDHPDSRFLSDVRMKLAETYYRRQDFPNAQTQFEILADRDAADPLAEKALFFAAESAMSSMGANSLDHAIVLFDRVVKLDGELKWAARNEQAVIERKLGKPQDALSLYEEVLKGNARPAERREAQCAKGDIFFEMGGAENYRRAIEAYDQLASEKDGQSHWRNQALFKKGLCLEKERDRTGALATFYLVLENEARPDRRRELFWFYKAGFNAARLLEDDSKWESAVAIYQKLAAAGGTRSEEAKGRLNQLRLEHFLWTE